jgi:hypothetical protein
MKGGEQFEHRGSCIDLIPEFGQGCKEMALQYSIGGWGSKKSSKGFTQPLQIPRKSPPSSERGSDNGCYESDG